MKRFGFVLTLILVLTACGPTPTALPTPDIQATTSAYSSTMVAATLTAQPTATLIPTETLPPTGTATMPPTETATADPASVLTLTAAPLPGAATLTPFTGTFSPGNITGLETGGLLVVNNSGEKVIIVTLTGITSVRSMPVYYSYRVTGSVFITIVLGSYQYRVEIPNKRYITGDFRQTNKDKTTMTVYLTKVAVHGP